MTAVAGYCVDIDGFYWHTDPCPHCAPERPPMGEFIVKVARGRDMYLVWSSIVESVTHWGSRAELEAAYDRALPDRFARADTYGTSSLAHDRPYAWHDETGEIFEQRGFLPRANLTAALDRWALAGPDADIGDLLTPLGGDYPTVRPAADGSFPPR